MKNRREYHAALSAEYALGTLRGPARLQFEQQMQQDPELAAEVARWQEAFAQLDNQLKPIVPPDSVWKRIQLQLPPKPPATDTTHQSTSSRLPGISRLNSAYIGWAVAACLAVVLVLPKLWESSSMLSSQATPVAILGNGAGTADSGQWVVTASNTSSHVQQLTITPLHAAEVASDRSLELWVIPAGGKPQSLGLLSNSAATQLALNDNLANGNSTLAISLEPKGGSPTGQPTGAVLYSGRITL
ncbi:anti-sigma factor [Rouxiella badensis]|jgi:anti-sigma-K factor RskA|uniref:anti-sigma factor n=1 Tax=Rouxiella badensis TaxID=1646377 RepID=UPI001D137CB5|nr:anti-sigma factor [Rouxiella badensis]MCC3717477.1 anti-sigma factor [Rouxiella badensis]MCC3727579.1 anti-sigma factor [Rouxiella badensis]MCC3732477.1 anti-sigma factor [Rouxiella badensis]MCC3740411.1 anti-sigma factor [Rouxiella badensis]MCC3758323.1 anti-sigma factor [Rouxiella badensis]